MSLSTSHSACLWCGNTDAPYRLPAKHGVRKARFCSHECVQQVHASLVSAARKKLQQKQRKKQQQQQQRQRQADPQSAADVSAQNCLFTRSSKATLVGDQEVVNEWLNKSSVVAQRRRKDLGAVRRLTYKNQIALEMILTQFTPSTLNATPCDSAANATRSYVRVASAGTGGVAVKFNWSALDETAVETENRVGTPTTLVLTPPNVVSHFASTAKMMSAFTSSPDLINDAGQPEVFRMALAAGSRSLDGFMRQVPGGEFVIRARARLLSPKVEFMFVGMFSRFPSFPGGGKNQRVLLVVPGNTVAIDVGQNRLEALTGLLVLTLEKNADSAMHLSVRTIDVVVPSRIPPVKLI